MKLIKVEHHPDFAGYLIIYSFRNRTYRSSVSYFAVVKHAGARPLTVDYTPEEVWETFLAFKPYHTTQYKWIKFTLDGHTYP